MTSGKKDLATGFPVDHNTWIAAAEKIPLTARTVAFCGATGQAIAAWRSRAPDSEVVSLEGDDPDDWTLGEASRSFDAVVVDGLSITEDQFGRIKSVLNPGAVIVCVAPNAGYWAQVKSALSGDVASEGAISEEALSTRVRDAGWSVIEIDGVIDEGADTVAAGNALATAAPALGVTSGDTLKRVSTSHWIARAVPIATANRLTIAAFGMKKTAGVTEARVDYPMAALGSLPRVRAAWGAGNLSLPRSWPPGVFILHRQFLNGDGLAVSVDVMMQKGWTIVSDIDDDPHHWRDFVDSDFRAYRAVHAVTVSTEPLAAMIRQWNPNVAVFGNAITALPDIASTTPKHGKVRIFFGALNRGGDWGAISAGLFAAASELRDQVTFVVVHDQNLFDRLPTASKEFHPTLAHAEYMSVLSSCDIALLPLADTRFNRLKSDLKFIECCAAGVVPICSPVIYAEDSRHLAIGVFATSADDWRRRIVDLARDWDQIASRRRAGIEYVSSSRMHRHQVSARLAFYQQIADNHGDLERQRLARVQAHAAMGRPAF